MRKISQERGGRKNRVRQSKKAIDFSKKEVVVNEISKLDRN